MILGVIVLTLIANVLKLKELIFLKEGLTKSRKYGIINVSNEREVNKMNVSRKEIVRIRKNLLRQMDVFIRENISEDIVIDVWFTCGLEDGWDERILTQYANDDDAWNDCINACRRCCKIEGIL